MPVIVWNVMGLAVELASIASSEIVRTSLSREGKEAKCKSTFELLRSKAVAVARKTPHCPRSILVASKIFGAAVGAISAFLLFSSLDLPRIFLVDGEGLNMSTH